MDSFESHTVLGLSYILVVWQYSTLHANIMKGYIDMARKIKIIVPESGSRPYARAEMTKYMRKKYSERAQSRWQTPEFQEKMREALSKKPNNLEKDFYNTIVEKIPSLVYVGDFGFFVNGKNPDFIIDEGKDTFKCIDLFGNYWHQNENPEDRINHFKNAGYDLLVIWENEWNNERDAVIQRISAWLEMNL